MKTSHRYLPLAGAVLAALALLLPASVTVAAPATTPAVVSPSDKQFANCISLRFDAAGVRAYTGKPLRAATLGGQSLAKFKLKVLDKKLARVIMQPMGWPGTYPPHIQFCLNETWPFGADDLDPSDMGVGAGIASANEVEFTYDAASKKIGWKGYARDGVTVLTQGSAVVASDTPIWYVTIRTYDPKDVSQLEVNSATVLTAGGN